MEMKVRALLSSLVVLITASLVGCGHYNCSSGAQFGNSTCTSSGGTSLSGGGGGTTSSASAYVFTADGGGIQELSLNTTAGTLLDTTGFTDPTTANSPAGLVVVAQGQYLYTSFPSVGLIYGWTIAADGTLTAISGSPFDAPYMIGSTIGSIQTMITNPAGSLLFVVDQADDAVYVYQIGSGGVLTAAGSPTLLPFEPVNVATDGLGKYLYVSNVVQDEFSTEIAAYSIGSSGSLMPVSGSPFVSQGSSLEFSMWQLHGEPSGKFMIGTTSELFSPGDPHLYVFNIQQSGTTAGAIAPVSGSPFATVYSPFTIAVQPAGAGDLVYSFSEKTSGGSNPVEGYQLNTSTGALTAISGSPFSAAAGDWGQFDQTGNLLFVYDGTTTVLSVFNVGTSATLTTPPVASVGSAGPWAPTDVP